MPPQQQSRDPKTHAGAALGAQLKAIRKAAKFTSQEAIAEKFRADRSVATKAETGELPLTEKNMQIWLKVCGVSGLHAEAIWALWHLARAKSDPNAARMMSWWEIQSQAHTLRYWAPLLIPGPAQTEGYARALFKAWGNDQDTIEAEVARRADHQAVLFREDAPDITIILWERVLGTLIGTAEIMREQIDRLMELAERPSIHVQILPGEGANVGLGGAIHLATTDTHEVLLLEGFTEDLVVTETARVRKASTTFNSVRSEALRGTESRAILEEARERWSK